MAPIHEPTNESGCGDRRECEWASSELSEDPCAPDDLRRLDAHLASCTRCRRDAEWHRRLADLLGPGSLPSAPEGIERRVRALIRRRRAMRWTGAAAALACGGAALIFLGPTLIGPPPSAPRSPVIATNPVADPADDLSDLAFLVSAPPIVPLDPVQASWIAVLTEASEGDSR